MTMPPIDWQSRLRQFFIERGRLIPGAPSLYDHCLVSAKDPRLWARPDLHAELVSSVVDALHLDHDSRVLEVGCASGYIASGLAARVAGYTGVDLAPRPLEVARRMQLPRATFQLSDGGALPFDNGTFDAAFAYDVFTNVPTFAEVTPLLQEMVRVVRPGGRVLAGSLTNVEMVPAFLARAAEVVRQLDESVGPVPALPAPTPADAESGDAGPPGEIVVYYFNPADFETFGRDHGLTTTVADVHQGNPYRGYRFNVIYTKHSA